jgi:sugar/nucleoside kinase (ribokinase family)
MLDGSGEKALTAVDTDCHLPGRADLDPDDLARTGLVHLMGDDLDFATWTATEARRYGTLVSLDLEPATAAHGPEALRPLLASTNIVFMNEAGCRSAFGEDIPAAVRTVLGSGPEMCVVTRGARGVLAADGRTTVTVPALRVPVRDTTGAGDAFIGAFLSRLLVGWDLSGATRFGTAAAASSIGAVGSRTALPTTDQVLASMGRTSATPMRSGAT